MLRLAAALLLVLGCHHSSVVVTAFSPSSISPPTFMRTTHSKKNNVKQYQFALFGTNLDQTRAALEDLMRKNADGDDSCNVETDADCEVVYDDDDDENHHQQATFAVFNDETNTPTPLQELQQHQRHSLNPQQPHLLTTAGRRHREVEMDLLSLLLKDDADNSAVNELMHLWMYETHDSAAAKQLENMEESCSPGLIKEMQQLETMMNKYPTWAEPKSRMAALLYFKGQTESAYGMCLETLALKPWHFECMHLLVLLSLRMRDFPLALYWARQGLPPMRYRPKRGPLKDDEERHPHGRIGQHVPASDLEPICTKRRTAWVERALKMAGEQWQQAEIDTARALQKRRGRKRGSITQASPTPALDMGDSWQ